MAIETGTGSAFISPSNTTAFTKLSGRSMLGKQADSRKPTAPMYTFTNTTDRDAASKTFISQAHVNVDQRCRTSPGAIYNVPSAIDKQVEALKLTAPSYSFAKTDRMKVPGNDLPGPGSYAKTQAIGQQPESPKLTYPKFSFSHTTRDQAHKVFLTPNHIKEQKGTLGPDPGHYSQGSAIGMQSSSMRRSAPAFSWGKTHRLQEAMEQTTKTLPPVGSYETWHALGKQPLSKFKTMPACSFGNSTWDKEQARFLTLSHSRLQQGTASPPNYEHQTQNTITSFGKQTLSKRQHSPSHRFSSAPRMVFKTSNTPGPGAYD
mmetsp:Transcript_5107/g.11114  ORF Transcript_5107/g.11114 Transcript_5107/m.11114 type:complete len:318 (-) Transcript_5107:859-1812(-)|eukprot:CAMPEP_0202901090 /NCGR_PEP_ID=MMETSP1392-20130828/13176_1 /ASSEMBLY_ACC=CAM_ASM_000868 /TAXON_ID=225041 /ORGANISM="Chlamydomonas chlamydogama, Strain SAG 11-48b" /LENGTH=317 /DNA_ID=CAMNT_0049587587 /DNA_START=146 /DNA_END=1099 /DNA_ORIENTATION=+